MNARKMEQVSAVRETHRQPTDHRGFPRSGDRKVQIELILDTSHSLERKVGINFTTW
jgi:hypothetical protein